jgi:hypothetical protein
VIDKETKEGKRQRLAEKMNALAMLRLTTAFTREGIMWLVSQSKTK